MLNAAVWFGSSLFLTFALPALFTPEMKRLLAPERVGFAAEAIFSRYFLLQYWCGGIALAHLIGEWFYFGRPMRRLNLGVVLFVFIVALLGGLWLQPKLHALHVVEYWGSSPDQRAHAAHLFAAWHGASMIVNVFVILCLAWYLWRMCREQDPERFVSFTKMRG